MKMTKCSDFEQLVALYVEEDLSGVERGRVETHLKECSSCWDLAEDLKESQLLFKSIREDIPDASALSAVRERVLSEVGGRESMTWFERVFFGLWRKTSLAGIALLMVGAGAMWLSREPQAVPPPPAIVVVAPVPEPQLEAPKPAPALKPVRRRVPEAPPVFVAATPTETTKQVAIKFLTDDPNIIIYWLVDEKGE